MKKAYLLSLELQPKGFSTHLGAKEEHPENISRETPSLHTPLASLQLNKNSQELIHSSKQLRTQRTPPDLLEQRQVGILTVALQDCIYLPTLKAAA